MEIVLKTREELGLEPIEVSNVSADIAKEVFKGLAYKLNIRTGKVPSMTFWDPNDKETDINKRKSITATCSAGLEAPVRAGKIKEEHLLGFTVVNYGEGWFFVAPKTQTVGGLVDDVTIVDLTPVTFEELAGY
jgi:hypothetical protein